MTISEYLWKSFKWLGWSNEESEKELLEKIQSPEDEPDYYEDEKYDYHPHRPEEVN